MEGNKLTLVLKGVRLGIMVLGVCLVSIIVFIAISTDLDYRVMPNGALSTAYTAPTGTPFLDAVLYIVYIVGLVCTLAAIGFGVSMFIKKLRSDFKSQIGTLIGFSVFLILGLISYFVLADSTVLDAYEASGIEVSENVSRFAGGSVFSVYILSIAAILSVVWGAVRNIIK